MKLNKKSIIMIFCAILSLTAGIGLRFYNALHSTSSDILKEVQKNIDSESAQYRILKEQGRFNILVLGEDNVDSSRRSDTILFVTIDIDDKNVRILSLPRDTRVEVSGYGYQKLNHAFAFGGPDLIKATVEKYIDQPILYYLLVDYDSFPALVDALGGIEIDVPKKMRYVDRAGKLDINIKPGLQLMDGQTALHFVRYRKDASGDIGRVHRQQQFIKALVKKAYDPSNIIKIPKITKQLIRLFKTDMSPLLAVQLAGFIQNELPRNQIFFSTLHGTPDFIGKLSYWIGDVEEAKQFISEPVEVLLSGNGKLNKTTTFAGVSMTYSNATDDINNLGTENSSSNNNIIKGSEIDNKENILTNIKSMSDSIAVLNGTGKAGIAEKVATKLQQIGIDVIHKGNAKHFDYKTMNIIYPTTASLSCINTAQTLGRLMNIPQTLIRQNKQAYYATIIIGHDYDLLLSRLDRIIEITSKKTH
ncbi:MAG: LCP family protein [Synergistaceae bacterium]|nr:LCP family protein [Synergistaceae bacterium]